MVKQVDELKTHQEKDKSVGRCGMSEDKIAWMYSNDALVSSPDQLAVIRERSIRDYPEFLKDHYDEIADFRANNRYYPVFRLAPDEDMLDMDDDFKIRGAAGSFSVFKRSHRLAGPKTGVPQGG